MLTLKQPLSVPREQRIRDAFTSLGGGMTTSRFVHKCREEGIWDLDEWESMAFRQAQNEVRRALRKEDEAGLPFAGQTVTVDEEDGSHLWQTRKLWLFEDYQLNVGELVEQRDKCQETAERLAQECRQRFGRAPSLALVVAVNAAD